jgi:hypothetical protein
MVETPFQAETLFIAAIGLAALETPGFFTTARAAILLTSITVRAKVKHRPAGREATDTLTKDCGTSNRHRFGEGALDNRRRSWEDDSRELGGPGIGATNEKPRLLEQPGFSSVRLRELMLPNPAAPERIGGDDTQYKTASGDEAQSQGRLQR